MAAAQAVSVLTGLVTVTVLTRNLGPETYGLLGFCIAAISYFGLLTGIGIDIHGTREIAKDRSRAPAIVGAALLLRIVLAGVSLVVLMAAMKFLQPPGRTQSVMWILAAGLIFVAANVEFAYQGLQKMTCMAVRQIFAALAVAVATLLMVSGPEDLYAAAAIPIAANLVTAAALLAHFRVRVASIDFKASLSWHQGFLRRSAPLALLGVLGAIQMNIDIVMLGALRPDYEVGLYTAASRLFAIAMIAGGILHSVYLPVFSETGSGTVAPPRETVVYARTMGFLGGALLIGGTVMSGSVIDIFFGAEFRGAETSLIILLSSAGVSHFCLAYATPLLAWQSDRAYLKILTLSAAVNVLLNAVLIPLYGHEGAAFATLASHLAMFLALAVIVWRAYRLAQTGIFAKTVALAVLCSLPMSVLRIAEVALSPYQILGGGIVLLGIFVLLCDRAGIIEINQMLKILILRQP